MVWWGWVIIGVLAAVIGLLLWFIWRVLSGIGRYEL